MARTKAQNQTIWEKTQYLMNQEGYPEDQATAIAFDTFRRGKLKEHTKRVKETQKELKEQREFREQQRKRRRTQRRKQNKILSGMKKAYKAMK